MARFRNYARLAGAAALTALLLFPSAELAAWKNVPLKERRVEKIPYRPQWVSRLKKDKFFKYKRKEFSSPRVSGDLVYVGSDSGYFYALKKSDGDKVWRFQAAGPVNSTPAFAGNLVLFGDDEGRLYALSATDGKEVWRADLGSEILSAPAVGAGRAFVATSEGKVAALDAQDGRILWETEWKPEFTGQLQMAIRGTASPTLDEAGDRLYAGFADGTVRCLSTSSGKVLWEKTLVQETKGKGFEGVAGTPVVDGDRLYVSTFDGNVSALSKKTGAVLWSQPRGSGVRTLVMGDNLVVSASNGHLYAYRKEDGTPVWDSPIGRGALTAPVSYKDLIAVGLSSETINFVDAEDGHVIARRFARKGIFSDPVVDEDRIYYLSNGGRLYSLKFVR